MPRPRSLKLSPIGKEQVERALTSKRWSVNDLANAADVAVPTAKSFRASKGVDRKNFVKFCEVLELDWEIASGEQSIPTDTLVDRSSTPSQSDDTPIKHVREHCRQKILNQHSRMRLLSGEEIGVDQLYVDVWLLNRSPRTYQVSQSKLLETFDLRNDRLGLGDRIRRTPGFEVANANSKLVILGKPGAGKTTFLKHLAVDWCKGEFQPDLIAVLIEFRRIQNMQWDLLAAIDKELGLDNWSKIQAINKQIQDLEKTSSNSEEIAALKQQLESLPLQVLLKQGKLIVLMDGLDEIPTSDLRRKVQDQLRQIAEDYPNNRFILTCRTQIMTSIPDSFTSVEVADFNPKQVKQFVQNWFKANGNSNTVVIQQYETFNNAIKNNSALKELTATPVLLSLMCLVLQDEGELPLQMTSLYQRGVKLLLRKWNDNKEIDGWEVGNNTYRNLSVEQKEALLTEIAARKFENPKNFVLFEQDEIAAQITQSLQLTNRSEGVAVLKAIEAQHGLLLERADELWSFSHLTFQEHFTIQWLTQLSSKQLAETIANQQWQKVIKQLVKSQQSADRLLWLIKQAIDQSIANEIVLTQFLTWIFQRAESVQSSCKPAATRALYFARDYAWSLSLSLSCALVRARGHARGYTSTSNHTRAQSYARARALDCVRARALNLVLARTLDHTLNPELVDEMEQVALPTELRENRDFQQWWQNKTQWSEQPCQIMMKHHSTGHHWQFTDAQERELQRYYDANIFLVNLMKVEGAVSETVRAEIEDALLLPWNELLRRYPEVYGRE